MMNFAELGTKKREDLLEMAKDFGISGYSNLKKQELIISCAVRIYSRDRAMCTCHHRRYGVSDSAPATQ
jgi:Rho termination factor, N-terminal domain